MALKSTKDFSMAFCAAINYAKNKLFLKVLRGVHRGEILKTNIACSVKNVIQVILRVSATPPKRAAERFLIFFVICHSKALRKLPQGPKYWASSINLGGDRVYQHFSPCGKKKCKNVQRWIFSIFLVYRGRFTTVFGAQPTIR